VSIPITNYKKIRCSLVGGESNKNIEKYSRPGVLSSPSTDSPSLVCGVLICTAPAAEIAFGSF